MAEMTIERIRRTRLLIPLKGQTPLIVHKWSEKARREMLEKHQGKPKKKTKRDPQAEYEATLYRTEDGDYGFPSLSFKAATVRAGKLLGVKMVDARQLIFVNGVKSDDGQHLLTPIEGEPRMRQDVVKISMTSDNRFRAEFPEWRVMLDVNVYPDLLSEESLLNLLTFAGETVGVGEWRPERNGLHGTFTIDESREIVVAGQ